MNGDKEKPPRNLPILPERNPPWIKLLKRKKLPPLLPLKKQLPLLLKKLLSLEKLNNNKLLNKPQLLNNNLKRNEFDIFVLISLLFK